MKNWAYTTQGSVKTGITGEGLPFFESSILGWQDDNRFSECEKLVVISAVLYDDGAECVLKNIYTSEEAIANPKIRMQSEEVEQQLLNEVQLWLNGSI
ncbi:hypothetical protein [Neobacillus vireti]|uniref:Phage protein n=1 Tax=Neobacillus vireti LMG 21834 TaxID=1131730 RepID=A0AB94IQ00_9BACI|nr:hypothetical protein [Neobacillus vireti]ETI69159.1 hypothetical protein BAVI_08671 [Neobacillus vireti LMG 21834]KLT15539.1 hypothetical protein AA980_23115 [Neobacillus vireti]